MSDRPLTTPQGCSQPGFAEQIDALIVDETPSAKKLARLHEHLAGCEGCRLRYDKVVLAARLLHGGPTALGRMSPAELARGRERLLGRARLAPDEPPTRRFVGVRGWVLALAAAGAVVAIAVPVALHERQDLQPPSGAGRVTTGEFQARGAPARVGQMVGLRAICIQRRSGSSRPKLRELPVDRRGRCEVDAALSFAYTNRGDELQHLFVLGVDDRFEARWYLPGPGATQSVGIERDAVDEPLPRTVRLADDHRPGLLRVFAIFSARPLQRDSVLRAVAAARQRAAGLEGLALLPLDDTEQRSLLIELVPAVPAPGDGAVLLRLDGPGPQKPQEN